MKSIKSLVIIILTTTTFLATANALTCIEKVEEATLTFAYPNNSLESSVYASVSSVKLLSQKGRKFKYMVQVDFDVNNGASSDSFPSEIYTVSAKGTQKSCKLVDIKLEQ